MISMGYDAMAIGNHEFEYGAEVFAREKSRTPSSSGIGFLEITLPAASSPKADGLPSLNLRDNVDWVERKTIRRALEKAKGVKKVAAENMGISQRALSYYLRKFGFG